MLKSELRIIYKGKRAALTKEEQTEFDEAVLAHFKTLDFSEARYVHVYLPIPAKIEPDTSKIIEWLKSTYPKLQIVLSKSDFGALKMNNYVLDDQTQIEQNSWGIPEPLNGIEIDADKIDAVIIPLLVCDKQGNRLGYGKGFYDRFLDDCRKDVLKIGLCYFEPIDHISDVRSEDVSLSHCVTTEKIHVF
ncbi:5-formyltetrahydrofolate cyclo-ligase [Sphingobacterium hungaricum]